MRITETELMAEGAQWTRLGLTKSWDICEKIAQRLAQRLGGEVATSVGDIQGKVNTTFFVAETRFTASARHAARETALFIWALRVSRKHQNSFILVVPYDARVDNRIIYVCDEFNSLKKFEEWLVSSDGVKFLLGCAALHKKCLLHK